MLNSVKGWIMNTNSLPKFRKVTDLSSLAETVARAKDIASWTPDGLQLERKSHQPVFICCQLGKGGREHEWIDTHYRTTDEDGNNTNMSAFTKDRYELWTANRGPDTYPVALRTGGPAANWLTSDYQKAQGAKSARLKGKLYQIRSDIIFQLDRLRHNGVVFNRELVDCLIPYRYLGSQKLGEARLSPEYVHKIKAWFYIADNGYWEPLIDGGIYFTPARLIKPRNPEFRKWDIEPYYMFNPREYATE